MRGPALLTPCATASARRFGQAVIDQTPPEDVRSSCRWGVAEGEIAAVRSSRRHRSGPDRSRAGGRRLEDELLGGTRDDEPREVRRTMIGPVGALRSRAGRVRESPPRGSSRSDAGQRRPRLSRRSPTPARSRAARGGGDRESSTAARRRRCAGITPDRAEVHAQVAGRVVSSTSARLVRARSERQLHPSHATSHPAPRIAASAPSRARARGLVLRWVKITRQRDGAALRRESIVARMSGCGTSAGSRPGSPRVERCRRGARHPLRRERTRAAAPTDRNASVSGT